MEKYFVTYACGGNLAGCYSVVEAETYGVARAVVAAVTHNKFAFMYSEKEFIGQINEYGLTEVPLQAQSFSLCEEKD